MKKKEMRDDFLLGLDEVEKAKQSLKKNGLYVIDKVYDQTFCHDAITFMDTYQQDDIDWHYANTETRIWNAEKKSPLLAQFYQACNLVMTRLLQKEVAASTLLAIRNKALDPADVSLTKGRWHLDAFSKQLKIFLFLTDTTEESGPFEFLPKTHTKFFKYRTLLKGIYIKPSNLWSGGKRAYQKLDDEWIEKLKKKGFESTSFLCKAGTVVIVDTSAIHRAKPCISNVRYALTAYYR